MMESPGWIPQYIVLWRGFVLHETVVTTWILMAFLALLAWLVTRKLSQEPSALQTLIEGVFSLIQNTVQEVLPDQTPRVLPFLATLWIFIFFANLLGLIPGFHSPTSDLSLTTALAVLVFFSVHWFGIRSEGWKNYLRHYLKPNPILLPFHLISELTRTLALAIRLFGNMMSLELAAFLVLMVAGFLIPVPLLILHIIEAVIQAYIFGMLALVYIAGGIQSHQLRVDTKLKELDQKIKK